MHKSAKCHNLVIGLTGGIGSGKSFVSDLFEKQGVPIVDSDLVARKVVEPDSKALTSIANRFPSVVNKNKELDRAALRTIIFDSPNDKKWLEELLHPLIRQETVDQLKSHKSTYQILSAPLLLETNAHTLADKILVVDVSEGTQLERATRRDKANKEQIQKVIDSQINRDERLEKADFIINNEGLPENTQKQVEELHQRFLELAQQNSTSS